MLTELAEGIMNRFEAGIFKNALVDGLFFQQAPQETSGTYGVFYITGATREEIMGTADDGITDIEVQFNLFTDGQDGGSGIALLTDRLNDCYNWQSFPVDGFTNVKMSMESIANVMYVDEYWQSTVIYSVWLEKE